MTRSLPNALTALRVILTAVLVAVLVGEPRVPAAIWLCLAIILTDWLDGQAARRLGACSAGGAHFDVAADAVYVLAAAAALGRLGLVPWWYVALVAAKLAEFIVTSRLLAAPAFYVFDPAGRVASALFFAVPPAVLVHYHLTGEPGGSLPLLLIALAAAEALVSAAARIARVLRRRA